MKFFFLFMVFLWAAEPAQANRCSRESSKIVRNVIRFKLWDIYKEIDSQMPDSCPFSLQRDIYYEQEHHKMMESYNKWKCDYCGKAFLAEPFIDRHFDRRHPDSIQQTPSSVCLSDYCDVYRCDVLSGHRTADFWDIKLCIEDDIVEMKDKCRAYMAQCIPKNLSQNVTRKLSDELDEAVCSYLTCSKYWDVPVAGSDAATAMYIIMSILITFSVLVYYCIFYQYFYTDAFSDNISYDPIIKNHRSYSINSPKGDIRQRSQHGLP
ncbi:uncharacterized protein LOC124120848 [Haliotis rufescens]|uniref:uncharacterized protein LOC124120848 n=1 Tax=Haliotis rufescens TaxID=6454 RepID=UPI001EB08BA8|nr:uncharacterized protein LOC124120848 [Haliotis rufescens]